MTILQGINIDIPCNTSSSIFVMTDGLNRYTSSNVIERDGDFFIHIDSNESKKFIPGRYTFQILNSEGLERQDVLKITANLLYSSETESYWQKVVRQCEERIAGKAIDSAQSVTVDGKSINYLSLTELFRLRDFALDKVAEEEKEEGIETSSPNDERKIVYKWSGL